MSKKDRKRLEQLFRMIGSPNAGEAENARRLILEMLARYRKTWNDLTDLMRGDTNADTWGAAFDDDRSAEQHARFSSHRPSRACMASAQVTMRLARRSARRKVIG
jgi:hypothetical protein